MARHGLWPCRSGWGSGARRGECPSVLVRLGGAPRSEHFCPSLRNLLPFIPKSLVHRPETLRSAIPILSSKYVDYIIRVLDYIIQIVDYIIRILDYIIQPTDYIIRVVDYTIRDLDRTIQVRG